MIPFFARVIHALFYDEAAFKRWIFGLFGFVATLASMIFAESVDVAFTWSTRQWIAKVATCLIAMTVAMVNPAAKKAEGAAPQP